MCGQKAKQNIPSWSPWLLFPYFYAISLTIRWQEKAHRRDRITGRQTRNKRRGAKPKLCWLFSVLSQILRIGSQPDAVTVKNTKWVCEYKTKVEGPCFLSHFQTGCMKLDSRRVVFLPLIASSFFVIVAVLFSPSFSLSLLVTLADKQVWTWIGLNNKPKLLCHWKEQHCSHYKWVRNAKKHFQE